MQHLTLTEVEGEEVQVNEQRIVEEAKRGKLRVVGKLTVERTVSKEVIKSTMAKAWKTSKPFTLVDIKPKLFVISFETTANRQKIINGRPWLFDSHLLALKPFDESTPPLKMNFNTEML